MAQSPVMSLLQHLEELRRRLLRSGLAFVVALMLCFYFAYEPMKYALVAPLEALNPETTNVLAKYNPLIRRLRPYLTEGRKTEPVRLYATTIMEKFIVQFNVSMLGGLVLSAPFLFYQAWAFVGAGLLKREKRVFLRYLPLSLGLFLVGMLFAYFVALPIAVIYLLSLAPDIGLMLGFGKYVKTVVWILASFGLVFQLPLVMMALARLGFVAGRTFAHYRRHAIVLIFILAALLAPSPEPFSQCLLAIPMVGLYELGIFLSRLAERRSAETASDVRANKEA